MFRINNLENGVILIDGDEELLNKIKGEDLSDIDVSDLNLDAHTLSYQYLIADSTPKTVVRDPAGNVLEEKMYHEAKRYAVLKHKYLDKFSAKK
jgi:hypothetical protein